MNDQASVTWQCIPSAWSMSSMLDVFALMLLLHFLFILLLLLLLPRPKMTDMLRRHGRNSNDGIPPCYSLDSENHTVREGSDPWTIGDSVQRCPAL
ncbi:hypothetical protein DOTSEDRAFT_72411 [Dothistroma septosporum NZE10]|uniref:Uncharacterized protein n=1 Tax=Dothistroma septosporum (strain NZE10 / CBS 128990) TaxID=675120 RepID=M2YLU8_DOTSN|nr:hypothetical protein DOTSEDRAFT_72411 [Dothistroma septosporum NZE10]